MFLFVHHLCSQPIEVEDEPCSQYRLSQYVAQQKSAYNCASFSAPPAPEGAAVNQVMSGLMNPFPKGLEVVSTEVKCEDLPCAKCLRGLGLRGVLRPVCCDVCKEYWHLKCAGLAMPPRHGSWGCPRCNG